MDAITRETAIQLCAEERAENRRKWLSAAHWQCWGCVKFTGGDPDKMCMHSPQGYNGCLLVNARYDRREGQP